MSTTLYLATGQGVGVVRGAGRHWDGTTHVRGKDVQCVLVDPKNHAAAYCGTFGAGLLKTTDSATSWADCASFRESNITAIALDASGRIYAGTEPSNVLRSEDGGETWQALAALSDLPGSKHWSFPPRPKTHHVKSILPDPIHPGELHVAVEAGALLRTTNNGGVWLDPVRSAPVDTHRLIAEEINSQKLFSAAGDGFFESDDDGNTWRRSQDGLDDPYCWSIAISSSSSRTLVMSAARNALHAHDKRSANASLYRREEGSHWTRVRQGLPPAKGQRAAVIAADETTPGEFFLSAEGLVFRSTDDGRHWDELSVNWQNGTPGHATDLAVVQL